MRQRALGHTGLHIAPLVFGGNVFGWTVDEARSFELLDAFVDAGFNAIDTADVYSKWVPGHSGGESEAIIGRWLKSRPSRRAQVLLFTKVGKPMGPGRTGLSRRWIEQAVEDSLRRLNTDVIDLYQSHAPDPDTPELETLEAYQRLLQAGKVRAIGCSNFNAAQLAASLRVAREHGLPAYQTLQPEYNLVARNSYDGPLRDLAMAEGLGVIPFYGLASGFLTGKYRTPADLRGSARSGGASRYLNERGLGVLAALDEVAARHGAQPAEVALAWLMGREGVTAPIASATSVAQLHSLAKAAGLVLTADDNTLLDRASTA
jgi:aryl-alcohol dehydrogenase-like predicted oxidoreductase